MATSQSNVVQIVESETELWTDEWISWWVHLACDTVWLEAENTSSHVVNIITPTSNNRVTIDFFAGNSSSCERALEGVPRLLVGDLFLQTNTASSADEGVLAATTS